MLHCDNMHTREKQLETCYIIFCNVPSSSVLITNTVMLTLWQEWNPVKVAYHCVLTNELSSRAEITTLV